MYGNRCPGLTASGVSTGKTSRWKRSPSARSSSSSSSSAVTIWIPSAARAGQSSFLQSFA